jgi:hypothetical protein
MHHLAMWMGVPGLQEKGRVGATYLVEAAFKPTVFLSAVVPFTVDDAKGDVLIRRAGNEANETCVLLACGGKGFAPSSPVFTDDFERGCFSLVDKIRIKYVELIPLDHLGGRVVMIVVSLIILVPFIAHLYTVKRAWLAWSIFVGPLGFRHAGDRFLRCEDFLVLINAPRNLALIESLGGLRNLAVPGGMLLATEEEGIVGFGREIAAGAGD